MYSRTVIEHFADPHNVGVIEDADGFARVKSTVHDDMIDLYIRVQDGRIADIKYRTFGCAAAIASSSITTDLAKGLPLPEAAALSNEQVVAALGGLPEDKIQCSLLAPEALHLAIEDYYRKKSQSPEAPSP